MSENQSNPTEGALPQSSDPSASLTTDPSPKLEADLIDIDYFSKIKLRVAQIKAAEPVPKSKKLLRLTLDVGPEIGEKQILAGIAPYYPLESLIGRKIVIVANLKPAKLMGLESQGMLLAASTEDGSSLFVLDPSQDMPVGSTVR